MEPVDDSLLLRQFVEDHSEGAFAALVTRHINLVHSVALRCVGTPHQAEEIVQSVFILLAKKAAQLRHDRALSSWLFQTTRLTARNFVRSETRRHRREQEAHMQSAWNESGDDVWRKISPLLDDAVARLSEKERQAIVLRFYEERSLHEIGTALEVSTDAAEKRIHRAVEKLRAFFAKRGVSVGAGGLIVALSANAVQAAPAGLAQSITAGTLATGFVTGVTGVTGVSTSTFILRALKLMTSTKLKITAVASAVILLIAGTLTFILHSAHGHHAGAFPTIEGVWEATAEIPDAPGVEQGQRPPMRILFTLSKTNGVYELLDTSPERVEPIELIYEHPVVRFKGSHGEVFEGNLTASGNEISGTVRAGGRVLHRLLLKRQKAGVGPGAAG
ncbi:MAG TPA: sigma-70 family RNA polymerase sigma factor [Verrucomicrobiae bacterium]|nr:sigma-70 family RNA polymerase sigma factor [Verrucomicrobiae bacterium]